MDDQELFIGGIGGKFTDFQRCYMKALYDQDIKPSKIAEIIKISRNAVYNMIKLKFQYPENKIKSRKLTAKEEEDNRPYSCSKRNRDLTAAQIDRDKRLNLFQVSKTTIQRILNRHGLKSKRKRVMQDITPKNREERLKIAQKMIQFSAKKFNKIFYSDESNICLSLNGVQLVRKYDFEKWSNEQFRKVTKVKPLAITIWMIISLEGVEHDKWTSSTPWINGTYYRNNILQKYIINDERQKINSDFGGYFQHDRSTSHTAKARKEYLIDNNVNVLDWSPKGADLSPIELCFGEIQRRMKQYFTEIKSQEDLWERICDMIFEQDFIEFIQKCYLNVPSKWQQVIDSSGGLIEC